MPCVRSPGGSTLLHPTLAAAAMVSAPKKICARLLPLGMAEGGAAEGSRRAPQKGHEASRDRTWREQAEQRTIIPRAYTTRGTSEAWRRQVPRGTANRLDFRFPSGATLVPSRHEPFRLRRMCAPSSRERVLPVLRGVDTRGERPSNEHRIRLTRRVLGRERGPRGRLPKHRALAGLRWPAARSQAAACGHLAERG